jgi:CRISPR/Cas system-associated exonuclease Cas4 (RecB family)
MTRKAARRSFNKQQGSLVFDQARKPLQRPEKSSTLREVLAKRRAPRPKTEITGVEPKRIWFSATSAEGFQRCPRCFWLEKHEGIRQPEGIVSRLANRFDVVIKRYFDLYRQHDEVPPMIEGKVDGKLQYPFQEKYWYRIPDSIGDSTYGFTGKLDECLVTKDGKHTPVDHKTASSDPNTKELIPAYQFQLDSYAFLLENNGHPTSGIGHLIYFFPGHGDKLHEGFPMEVSIKTLKTDPSRVLPRLKTMIGVLQGPLPQPNPSCTFCEYVEKVKKF